MAAAGAADAVTAAAGGGGAGLAVGSVHAWETPAWSALRDHTAEVADTHLRELLKDDARNDALFLEHDGIAMDFSRQRMTTKTLGLLVDLARAARLPEKMTEMATGRHINVTEDRAVLHMALRAPRGEPLVVDGVDVVEQVHGVLDRVETFAAAVRSGEWKGVTGKPLTNIVSVGIGGSYLGPEFVYESLRMEPAAKAASEGRCLRFLANVDPVDVARALEGLDPETTLVVIISKTFTTAETMLNARTLRDWLLRHLSPAHDAKDVVRQHVIACTTNVEGATAFGILESNLFGFWDWVGGRYSVCSAVGVVPLALHYGFPIVRRFLDGAHAIDKHFLEAPLEKNLPVVLGLLGVWNSTFLGFGCRALLPYSQALIRFAAHIQQVDMESNGKRVAVDGTPLPFDAGEVDFGEPGTNGQHSFYQLIHQGRVVPCDFLGFCESQAPVDLGAGEPVSNHDELMSNFFAQPDALAKGKSMEDLVAEKVPADLREHKLFAGNRPSTSLLLPRLDAYAVGQLLALYEHRTAVQGFVWGLPSFDQWGVELGKVLAKHVRGTFTKARGRGATATVDVDATVDAGGYNSSTARLLKKYLHHA